MIGTKELAYKNAYFELNEILKRLPITQKEKIPKSFINNIQNKMQKNNFVYCSGKGILEQNLMNESKALLIEVYNKFLATEKEKSILDKYRNICVQTVNKEKSFIYDSNFLNNKSIDNVEKNVISDVNISNENNIISNEENDNIINDKNNFAMVEVKHDNFIKRIFKKIKMYIFGKE